MSTDQKLRDLSHAIRKLRILEERARQQGPGGLMHFLRYHWDVLEPGNPFIDGWAIQAIAEHLEAVTFNEINRLLINVSPGFSKAMDCDTQVLTTSGWKRHGDLQVGDYVYGPDGLPKKVTGRTPNVIERCFEVEFDDGASVVAGEGHLWAIEREEQIRCERLPARRGKNNYRWRYKRLPKIVRTPELRPKQAWEKRCRPDRIVLTQPIAGVETDLPIDPYVLGVWLGDGAAREGMIYGGQQDLDHFAKLGRSGVPNADGVSRIGIDGLRTKLRLLGLLNNKHIPSVYLGASVDQRWQLLRGLMDTDGCASPEGWCSFVNANKVLLDGVASLLASLGLKYTINSPYYDRNPNFRRKGPYWRIRFTPPPGAKIFQLERKQSRLSTKKQKRSTEHRYVSSIKDVGERLVNCIEVDGRLYLATDKFITTHNSLLTSVYWPAWEWGPMNMGHLRGLSFSYAAHLTERDNDRLRTLITSKKYQELWGDRFKLTSDAKIKISNDKMGWQLASSVRGVTTGERSDRVRCDDGHNVSEGESERVRGETVRWFKESMSNRLNHMQKSSIVVIMQRVHELDIAGAIIDDAQGMGYEHLCIPMRYEIDGPWAKSTKIGWEDPRKVDGELAWPERFPPEVVDNLERDLGPWAFASQYQQNPAPRGGGIIKRHWFRLWDHPQNKFPLFENVVAAVDPAYTEKDENDPSAMSVWGTFRHPESNEFGIMLIHAWRKRLPIHGDTSPQFPGESDKAYERRCGDSWGLVEWIWHVCKAYGVHHLFIESKASGISVFQEIERRQSLRPWACELVDTGRSDKIARVTAVQPIFSQGLVWAPDRDFADMVINELINFPKYKFDDLADTASLALRKIREMGLLQFQDEREYEEYVGNNRDPITQPLYPV